MHHIALPASHRTRRLTASRARCAWVRACCHDRERETQPAGARLFIAALTANVLDCVAEECAAAGIDLHLSKPLRPDDIPALWAHATAAAART